MNGADGPAHFEKNEHPQNGFIGGQAQDGIAHLVN